MSSANLKRAPFLLTATCLPPPPEELTEQEQLEQDAAVGKVLKSLDSAIQSLVNIPCRYLVLKAVRNSISSRMECMVLSPNGLLVEPSVR